jgi:hypothetical protein
VDFDGIMACIAPRPLLIIAPKQDRDHSIAAVKDILSTVSGVYGKMQASDRLQVIEPLTYNHFTVGMQLHIADWLLQQKNAVLPEK